MSTQLRSTHLPPPPQIHNFIDQLKIFKSISRKVIKTNNFFRIPILWPPLWSSGQSSWLQIQRSWVRFDSRRYQIFWEVTGLERSSLNLVSTTEELFGIKSSGSGLENRVYGRGDPLRWARDTSIRKSGTNFVEKRRSLGIVSSRTKATEFYTFL
jgi:hypothetical protein